MDLTTVKNYLRVDGDHDDDLLEIYIAAAISKTEDYCSTFWTARDTTETHVGNNTPALYLYRLPVNSVDKLTINGEENDSWVQRKGTLYYYWPSKSEIKVTYNAGFTEPPATAKLAILQTIAMWYENKSGVQSQAIQGVGSMQFDLGLDLPMEIKSKLSSLRQRIL